MSSTLTSDKTKDIRRYLADQVRLLREEIIIANETNDKPITGYQTPVFRHVAQTAAERAYVQFKIMGPEDRATVRDLANEIQAQDFMPSALVVTQMFRFTRDDLLDIAHWAERDDGYPASEVQVNAFVRTVIRGNLDELRKERVPPPEPMKIKIKRRKA
jgi:hypothetical protein